MTEYLQVRRARVREGIEPAARQLDEVVAIGDLYRQRYPELLAAG